MGLLRKKGIALIMCLILSAQISWASPVDLKSHWAYDSMLKLAEARVFSPVTREWDLDDPISRGAFTRLMNRTWGNSMSTNETFDDVGVENVYFADISRAVAQGYVDGYPDGQFKPESTITRQEAAVIVTKAAKIESTTLDVVKAYEDSDSVPEWSRMYMSNMIMNGYFSGYPDKTIRSNEEITYGEALALIDNVMGLACQSDQVYDDLKVINGNVSVIKPNTMLKNMIIEGNLIIGGQVEEGDVTLSGVEVTGDLLVFGGGTHSIHLENSKVGKLIVDRKDAPVRIYAKEGAIIERTIIETSAILEEDDGVEGFSDVEIAPVSAQLNIDLKGTFDKVYILKGEGQAVAPPDDESVKNTGIIINIPEGSKIADLKAERKSEIKGNGHIELVQVKNEYVSIKAKVERIVVSDDVDGVEINGKKIIDEKDFNPDDVIGDKDDKPTSDNRKDRDDKNEKDKNDEPNEEPKDGAKYILETEPTFIGAPTLNITVKKDGALLKNCTLYMDSRKFAVDQDGDGILCIPSALYDENSLSIGYGDEIIEVFENVK